MDVEQVTPEPTPAPVIEPVASPEDASLADHEAQFGANREPAEETAEPAPEKPRHRAKSQQASPAEVPRIQELTRKLREAERRAEDAERRATARVPETDRRVEPAPVAAAAAPTEKFKFTPFETWAAAHPDIDPADAWEQWESDKLDARDAWRDAKQQAKQAIEQRQQADATVLSTYAQRVTAFAATTPDFHEKMDAANKTLDDIPDLLFKALIADDNGPELAYYLVTHPVDLDEMCLLTEGKAVSDASVALLRRRLAHYRSSAALTGSAPAIPAHSTAPRPPNPVRTGPLKSSDELPGDEASLAAHEKAFGPKRR